MFQSRTTNQEDMIILKLENDISETDPKSTDLESFWSSVNTLCFDDSGFLKDNGIPKFSFEILSDTKGTSFYFVIPKKFKSIIMKKLNSAYPYIDTEEIQEDYIQRYTEVKDDEFIHSYELRLTENCSNSLKTKGTEKFFLNNILNTINHFNEEESSLVQITMKPVPESSGWGVSKLLKLNRVKGRSVPFKVAAITIDFLLNVFVFVVDAAFTDGNFKKRFNNKGSKDEKSETPKDVEDKFSKPSFNVCIRVSSKSKDDIVAQQNARGIATAFQDVDDKNKLRPFKINIQPMKDRTIHNKNNVLTSAEISQLAQLPHKYISADNISKTSVKMPYDKNLPSKGVVFGFSPQQNNKEIAFPMSTISLEKYDEQYKQCEKMIDNLCKPRLILGQMGTGKSEWIINYTISLIKSGVGVVIVDPKNDTQKRLIESIPDKYLDKIDYLNLGDLAFPPALNLLRKRNQGDATEISLMVQSLINFFKKEFGKSWGFAMQQLIMMTGNAILLDEVSSMYEFQLMLINQEYREKIIHKIESMLADTNISGRAMLKELLQFWKMFNSMSEKEQRDRISSTMNKVGIFMGNRIIRAIVSQQESYDFRKAGDSGRITIINIPDGELGDENTRLLASFINKAVWLDFRSRANVPIDKRYPTVWLIEEAHMIMDEEFIPVLTQSRGYRLGVTILTQGLTNFENRGMKELKELILTNCKNKIVFRVGPQDARALAEEFAPLTSYDLMNCPDYHFYSKILLDGGIVSDVFFAHAPDMAKVLRSYDEYKESHRFGKLTIDQIEDQLDERHQSINTMAIYSVDIGSDSNLVDDDFFETKTKRSHKGKGRDKIIDVDFFNL